MLAFLSFIYHQINFGDVYCSHRISNQWFHFQFEEYVLRSYNIKCIEAVVCLIFYKILLWIFGRSVAEGVINCLGQQKHHSQIFSFLAALETWRLPNYIHIYRHQSAIQILLIANDKTETQKIIAQLHCPV